MISSIFHAGFYNPIYNLLVFLVSVLPHGDVGLAVILITIVVKVVLLPLSLAASRSTRAMKNLEPKLKEIKEKHKDDKEALAAKTMELYRTEKVNPFAGIITLFVQMPVLFALYFVFLHEPFPAINTHILYSFTPIPAAASLLFLGLVVVAGHSLVLAAIAALAQYAQVSIALPKPLKPDTKLSAQEDFTRIIALQARYLVPVLVGTVAYSTGGAVALYFITSALVGILQELYVRKQFNTALAEVAKDL
jgi:YidC/Oxa1 family membrane protein insertase